MEMFRVKDADDYDWEDDARKSYDVAISALRERHLLTQAYSEFLATKVTMAPALGFDPVVPFPKAMKPFQSDIATWACRRGRSAIFAGTGLGKTLMELTVATNIDAVLAASPKGPTLAVVSTEVPEWLRERKERYASEVRAYYSAAGGGPEPEHDQPGGGELASIPF